MSSNGDKLVAVPPRGGAATSAAATGVKKRNVQRLLRSVVLGTLALGAGVWYFAGMFGVELQELLGYMGISALLILGLVVCAALLGWLLRLLRR